MSTSVSAVPNVLQSPRRVLAVTAFASLTGLGISALQGWPLWAIVSATAIPWIPLYAFETARTYRNYGWLALFFVLVVTQSGHVLEHVAQVTQIHVLHKQGPAARGVFGNLDIEWVHFIWNAWVMVAVLALLVRFRRNPWLWAAGALAAWHMAEHSYIMSVFLRTDQPGNPGLLASGGKLLGGGLAIKRPDLHLYYNLAETIPLVVAFVWQVRRALPERRARAAARPVPQQ